MDRRDIVTKTCTNCGGWGRTLVLSDRSETVLVCSICKGSGSVPASSIGADSTVANLMENNAPV